jgi:2-polyprenyl-6-methoxyphenol hydroxylase-like FAD-dependent oxidoreductase
LKPQHIAIIGAGSAGLALARILAAGQHQVTILEKAPTMENVGAGILLQPAGLAVFQHLGVLDSALALGSVVDGLEGRLANGQLLVNSHYREVEASCYGLGIHRAALCHVLMQGLDQTNIIQRMGVEIQQIEQHGQQMRLIGITSTEQYFADNYDAVIIANGARSQLRPKSWVKLDQAYPWGAAWCIVSECHTLDKNILHQFYDSTNTMMGVLPTGKIPQQADQALSSVFWSLPTTELQQWLKNPDSRLDWLGTVQKRWPEVAEWLQQVMHSHEQWLPAHYRDVVLNRHGEGRVGIIGDAAHAMSPQLGQGVNMALLDAWALGQAIEKADDWQHVWQNYHQMRRSSIQFYQWLSRTLTPFYQSHRQDLGWARDVGFTWMYRIPWLRQQMARTISGVKLNPLQEMDLQAIAQPLQHTSK